MSEPSTSVAVEEYEQSEDANSFSQTILVNAKQLTQFKNIKFDLHKSHGFKNPYGLGKYFGRSNIVYYGMISKEYPVQISSKTGTMMVPIVTNEDIRQKLECIPEKDRSKVSYLFISTIQIILKSTFDAGINSPIDLVLFDGRLRNTDDMVLGTLHANLAYTTVKFNVNVQYGIPLVTNDLSKALGFAYNFHNTRLMNELEYPFTITYRVNYALTNSSHSLNFGATEKINLDKLFGDIAHIEHASRPLINNTLFTSVSNTNIFRPLPDPLGRRSFSLPRIKERPFISELPTSSIPQNFQIPELHSAITKLRNQVEDLTKTS